MLVEGPFDIALVVLARRRELKLRQADVCKAAKVGAEWLIDLEHGKPGVELGLVMRTLDTLGLEISLRPRATPPAWTRPITDASCVKQRRVANLRRGPVASPAKAAL